MAYEVLARKYRPQQFGDVVGQAHVTQTLRNAVTSGRIANAYLFVGPRGTGKTTLARIVAKSLNCQNRKKDSADPCETCDACVEIRKGSSLDVMEIDGASNNGVEQVRELRDTVKYAPTRGPYKIYIIDEVHMLSIGAFNALLKTLEEPPPHVRFIFATTEVHKVPATILSRCQRFDLRRISTRDIVAQLDKIAKAEGVTTDTDALLAIARGAEGGLRDAESALDQLISFRGKEIHEDDVLSVFGLVSRKGLEDIGAAILKGNIPAMLNQIAAIEDAGKDLGRLALELLDYFRNLLVAAHAGSALADQDGAESQLESLKKQAATIEPARLLRIVEILIELQGTLKFALSRRTATEVALIRAARVANVATIDEVLAMLRQLKAGSPAPAMVADAAPVSYVAAPPPAQPQTHAAPAAAQQHAKPAAAPVNELEMLTTKWREFIDHVAAVATFAKTPLLNAKPVSVTTDRVVIGIDSEFAHQKDELAKPRSMSGIQSALKTMLRRAVNVEVVVLGPSNHKLPTDHAPTEKVAAADKKAPSGAPKKSKHEWTNEPEVKRAIEAFSGGIVDIRE